MVNEEENSGGQEGLHHRGPLSSSAMQVVVDSETANLENRPNYEADPALIAEIVQFLEPDTRLDVRREALKIILGMSAPLDGSAERAFTGQDFLLGKALCRLCEATLSDRAQTLSAITNFASLSSTIADYVLQERTNIIKISYEAASTGESYGEIAARLLANCSRLFPGETQLRLLALDAGVLERLIDRLTTSRGEQLSTTLGFTLVNLATVSRVRKELARRGGADGNSLLHKLYPVIVQSEDEERRRIAADTLRNCTFDDSLHTELLDESDDYLVAVLTPLADEGDNLDAEETDKLPLRLQYFEGRRTKDISLRKKLVDALYQLCATRHGRERLRSRGVYPLMRELDKARQKEREGGGDPSTKMLRDQDGTRIETGDTEEHTLHALIGVLIRYEDEMGIDHSVESIRDLQ